MHSDLESPSSFLLQGTDASIAHRELHASAKQKGMSPQRHVNALNPLPVLSSTHQLHVTIFENAWIDIIGPDKSLPNMFMVCSYLASPDEKHS
jgi:hypothetical protein